MADALDNWVVSKGVAVPESDYSEVPELDIYHPRDDEYNGYICRTERAVDGYGEDYIRMRGLDLFNIADPLMNSLNFRLKYSSSGQQILCADIDLKNEMQVLKDRFRLAKWVIQRVDVSNDNNIPSDVLFVDYLYWLDQKPVGPIGIDERPIIKKSTWQWIPDV